ncbi:cytochrome P450 4V2-like isoform X2 [Haemaphysalis longicornis]
MRLRAISFSFIFGDSARGADRRSRGAADATTGDQRRGFETTASSITFTLFLLDNHPEVQAKVQEEIDPLLADDKGRDVTIEDIKQMKYLECVLKNFSTTLTVCLRQYTTRTSPLLTTAHNRSSSLRRRKQLKEKEKWRSRRKVIAPAFHSRILDTYAPVMNRRAREMVRRLEAMVGNGFFDVLPAVRLAGFGILFETALGVQIDEAEVQRLRLLEINDEIGASIIARMLNIAHWLDAIYNLTQASKDFRKNVKFIHDYNRRIVKQRLAEYKAGKVAADSKKSLLDLLIHMHVVDGTLTEEEVKNEVTSIFIGGFETTASSITFTLFLLGNHPEVQAKVQEEIDELFADDTDRDVTIEDTKKMQYLECVVKESMRLYPPVPLIARTVDEDMKVGEYTIPKGSAAVAGIYFIQRHPRFFDEPDKFMPERFLDTKEKCPFLYIPFSAGLRNCTGQKFADLEDKILLAQIMRRFTVTSKLRMEELQLSLEVVLKATQGIEIQLHPRDKPPRPQ